MLLTLLAQATVVSQQPVNMTGLYVVSGSGMLTAAIALWKAAFNAGRFQEFKEQQDRKDDASSEMRADFVARTEVEMIVKHIDQRFDDVSRQLAEIRKLKLEGMGR